MVILKHDNLTINILNFLFLFLSNVNELLYNKVNFYLKSLYHNDIDLFLLKSFFTHFMLGTTNNHIILNLYLLIANNK